MHSADARNKAFLAKSERWHSAQALHLHERRSSSRASGVLSYFSDSLASWTGITVPLGGWTACPSELAEQSLKLREQRKEFGVYAVLAIIQARF